MPMPEERARESPHFTTLQELYQAVAGLFNRVCLRAWRASTMYLPWTCQSCHLCFSRRIFILGGHFGDGDLGATRWSFAVEKISLELALKGKEGLCGFASRHLWRGNRCSNWGLVGHHARAKCEKGAVGTNYYRHQKWQTCIRFSHNSVVLTLPPSLSLSLSHSLNLSIYISIHRISCMLLPLPCLQPGMGRCRDTLHSLTHSLTHSLSLSLFLSFFLPSTHKKQHVVFFAFGAPKISEICSGSRNNFAQTFSFLCFIRIILP